MISQQLIISGIGGQGILFITRLLAETAISMGLPVLTSETHGMAQRGGIVISHLKIGEFFSPLVQPGQADGLLALKPDNIALHRHFLRETGWIAVNSPSAPTGTEGNNTVSIPADALALEMKSPQSVNLMVLGLALAKPGQLFCSYDDVRATIERKLAAKPALLKGSLAAFQAGVEFTDSKEKH